jgi:AraC-like DNA-binding protein
MLIHDTDQVPAQRRAAAVTAALSEPSLSTAVITDGTPYMRLEGWTLGGLGVSRVSSTAMRVVRTPHTRSAQETPAIALGVYVEGVLHQTQSDQMVRTGPGEIFLMETGVPHDHDISGRDVKGCAVHLPLKDLALARQTVRLARPKLRESPFYDLLRGHLLTLADTAEVASRSSAASTIGRTTADLVRVLVASAAGLDGEDQPGPTDDLLVNIKSYVETHLHDPNLDAAQIARAHHISVRQLYKVCAGAGVRLGEWTMSSRLEGAKSALGDPAESHRTIFDIASQWGFVDASHFSARFRVAYGSTPRQWREQIRRGMDSTDALGAPHNSPRATSGARSEH